MTDADLPVIEAQIALLMQRAMQVNDKVLALKKQLHQYKMAISECKSLKEDINNKAITKVLVPTIGNNFVMTNPSSDKYRKMINDREKMFESSVVSIGEQIRHNRETLNETVIQLCREFKKYLNNQGLEVLE